MNTYRDQTDWTDHGKTVVREATPAEIEAIRKPKPPMKWPPLVEKIMKGKTP